MRAKSKKSVNKPTLVLPPPPNGWSVFRRSGHIKEPERMAVLAIQEDHPDLEEFSSNFLVEAYRSYKRKHLDEIAMEAAKKSSLRVIPAGTQIIRVGAESEKESGG